MSTLLPKTVAMLQKRQQKATNNDRILMTIKNITSYTEGLHGTNINVRIYMKLCPLKMSNHS